jgi:hypothetical protein
MQSCSLFHLETIGANPEVSDRAGRTAQIYAATACYRRRAHVERPRHDKMQSHPRIAQLRSRPAFTVLADELDLQPCDESGGGQMYTENRRLLTQRSRRTPSDKLTRCQMSPELKIPGLLRICVATRSARGSIQRRQRKNSPPECASPLFAQRRNIESRNGSAQPLERKLAGWFGRG